MGVGWGRLFAPVLFLAIAAAINAAWRPAALGLGLGPDDTGFDLIRMISQASVWLGVAFLAKRLVHELIWKGLVVRQTGVPATRLLTDLVDGLILLASMVAIAAFVFHQSVTGVVATSGVAVAVIGFALKSLISDLFSGIAITLERPFRLGDWVEITGGAVGAVRNVSWRTTGLLLESGLHVVVPNGRLSEMVLRIYDHRLSPWRDEIDITLGYDVPADQVERILLSAAADVPEIAAQESPPDVRIVDFAENGTKWRLRFWVPDYPSRSRLRYAVQRNILRNLHFAGIAVPPTRIDAHIARPLPAPDHGPAAFLGRVSLFEMLAAEEMADLTADAEFRLVPAGTALVREGEDGASLFVIKEGLFEVLVGGTSVAQLKPGAFFGEMSLLTGAPRSATVRAAVDCMVLEITRDELAPILEARPAVVEAMSRVLAERQLQNDRRRSEAVVATDGQTAHQTLAVQLRARMRAFFGLTATAGRFA